MIKETISISAFRANLRKCCHAVRLGKKELTVTYHGEHLFKVVQVPDDHKFDEFESTLLRNHMNKFVEIIEQKNAVILTAYDKPLVKCELIK
jgi:PHD/YefM family antitoxin component YafN of YafNO toxin-antitoxin module